MVIQEITLWKRRSSQHRLLRRKRVKNNEITSQQCNSRDITATISLTECLLSVKNNIFYKIIHKLLLWEYWRTHIYKQVSKPYLCVQRPLQQFVHIYFPRIAPNILYFLSNFYSLFIFLLILFFTKFPSNLGLLFILYLNFTSPNPGLDLYSSSLDF